MGKGNMHREIAKTKSIAVTKEKNAKPVAPKRIWYGVSSGEYQSRQRRSSEHSGKFGF